MFSAAVILPLLAFTTVLSVPDTSAFQLSFDGCVRAKQAAIVLPSTNEQSLKAAIDSIGTQFPVTFFATDAHFSTPSTLHALQDMRKSNLHTVGYQFNPELTRLAKSANPAQVQAAIAQAKLAFKQYLNQSLMYVLVPSQAGPEFIDTMARAGVYPVVPNADADELGVKKARLQQQTTKGVVMTVNPGKVGETPEYANELHSAGFQITPLTHCLPVNYNDAQVLVDVGMIEGGEAGAGDVAEADQEFGEDLSAEKQNSKEEVQTQQQSSGISWGMIAIGAFVIGGIVLAAYFYNNQ